MSATQQDADHARHYYPCHGSQLKTVTISISSRPIDSLLLRLPLGVEARSVGTPSSHSVTDNVQNILENIITYNNVANNGNVVH